jgi:hypothetical protein
MPGGAMEQAATLSVFRIGRKEEDRDMGVYSMKTAIALLTCAALAAGSVAALAASDRTGRFSAPSWPEETIYKPECRSVHADGTWVRCSSIERDW